jgi:hypothetical protein
MSADDEDFMMKRGRPVLGSRLCVPADGHEYGSNRSNRLCRSRNLPHHAGVARRLICAELIGSSAIG